MTRARGPVVTQPSHFGINAFTIEWKHNGQAICGSLCPVMFVRIRSQRRDMPRPLTPCHRHPSSPTTLAPPIPWRLTRSQASRSMSRVTGGQHQIGAAWCRARTTRCVMNRSLEPPTCSSPSPSCRRIQRYALCTLEAEERSNVALPH